MLRSWEKMRYDGFSRAIQNNAIKEPSWHRRLNNRFLTWVMTQPIPVLPELPNKRAYQTPEQNPLTQRYWENTRGLLEAPTGTVPWLVELARISIPDESVAIVKGFEQFIDVEGESPLTASADWGNPFILTQYGITVEWYFRLERNDGGEPAWINISSPTPRVYLPGEPHFDVHVYQDVWFPAGSPPSQNFHMTIGGRYRLRVLALVARTEQYDLKIAAKIRGFDLSNFDPNTLFAIRANW